MFCTEKILSGKREGEEKRECKKERGKGRKGNQDRGMVLTCWTEGCGKSSIYMSARVTTVCKLYGFNAFLETLHSCV